MRSATFASMKHWLRGAALLLLYFISSCSKKEEVIPARTLQMSVKGQQVVFTGSQVSVVVSKQGTDWALNALTADQTSIVIHLSVQGMSVETPHVYSTANTSPYQGLESIYGFFVLTDYTNGCSQLIYSNQLVTFGTGYNSGAVRDPFVLAIKTVDQGAHTMSGTFSGTYYKGCDRLDITDGKFNLPYTVSP